MLTLLARRLLRPRCAAGAPAQPLVPVPSRSSTYWSRYFDPPLGKDATTEPPRAVYPEPNRERLPDKKARLLFASNQRRLPECASLLLAFAEAKLEAMAANEADEFDRLLTLQVPDEELLAYAHGSLEPPPPQLAQLTVFHQLAEFARSPPMPPRRPLHHQQQQQPVESTDQQRQRLLYQSRKRGILENGLLLSCYADRYLAEMTPEQLNMYDALINKPSNDWDIYYWLTGARPLPAEYDNAVARSMIHFVRNEGRESRIRQPDLRDYKG